MDCFNLDPSLLSALNALKFEELMHFALLAHERQVSELSKASAATNAAAGAFPGERAEDSQRHRPVAAKTRADGALEICNNYREGNAPIPMDDASPEAPRPSAKHLRMSLDCSEKAQDELRRNNSSKNDLVAEIFRSGSQRSQTSLAAIDSNNLLEVLQEEEDPDITLPMFERFMKGPFEFLMNFLVISSAATLFMELEVKGRRISQMIESPEINVPVDESASEALRIVDHMFNAIFVVELVIRFLLNRKTFFWDPHRRRVQSFNCLDLFIVIACSAGLYVLPLIVPAGSSSTNLSSLRLLRLLRLTRALRVIRVMTAFSKLRILLNTVASSFMSLFWAMILIFLVIYGSALFLCQMLQSSLEDSEMDPDLRQWIYRYYGSGSRSLWTLFEVTFSGGWPSYARRLIEDVHWTYGIFFATYVWVVVFAITRIVTALFLKDTLQVANDDAEAMVREAQAKKAQTTKRLKEMFEMSDKSGDGMISLEEFKEMAALPTVKVYFHQLDIQVPEVCELFSMLDHGTGQVSYDEFCTGILRLKGQARAMDVISTMRDCKQILDKCRALEARMDQTMAATRIAAVV